jgi:hypothetical protein
MEQTRQQVREMLAVREAFISRRELEEADARYAKMEPLTKAKMKAINELMERRKALRTANYEKMMAKWEAH